MSMNASFQTGVLEKFSHDKGANEKRGDIIWHVPQDYGAYTTQFHIDK